MEKKETDTSKTPLRVTKEQARKILEEYKPSLSRGPEIDSAVTRGVIRGSTEHMLIPSEIEDGGIRHVVQCRLTGLGVTYPVVYFSLLNGESPADFALLTFKSREVTFTGPAGVSQALPKSVKEVESVLFGHPLVYIGYDWMDVSPLLQPDAEDLTESAVTHSARMDSLSANINGSFE